MVSLAKFCSFKISINDKSRLMFAENIFKHEPTLHYSSKCLESAGRFWENIAMEIVIVALVAIAVITCVCVHFNREDRKRELKSRRQHFDGLREWKCNPDNAIEWLTSKLLGTASIHGGGNTRHFHFHFTLQELSITPEQHQETVLKYLQLWWEQLNKRKPLLKEAVSGAANLNRELDQLLGWMQIYNVTQEQLGHDARATRAGYMDRCCEVLEENLYHYPSKPFQDISAEMIRQALLDYWGDPGPELIGKWQGWVEATKKRQANRLLIRLRQGRYSFPHSDERVNRLLGYLQEAKASPEDIGTTATELEELRGFLIAPKKSRK